MVKVKNFELVLEGISISGFLRGVFTHLFERLVLVFFFKFIFLSEAFLEAV